MLWAVATGQQSHNSQMLVDIRANVTHRSGIANHSPAVRKYTHAHKTPKHTLPLRSDRKPTALQSRCQERYLLRMRFAIEAFTQIKS